MATSRNIKSLFDISGRNYIVTGGAQGIGSAIVLALAELGANVVALDIKTAPSVDYDSLAKTFGVTISYVQADVTDEKGLGASFQAAFKILGTVHGLVTCAGIALEKAFEETSWAECRRLQDINVTGTYFSTQLVAERFKQQGTGGSIVLIASITSHTVLPQHRMSAYSASKGAVRMLSEALAVELGGRGIRVNSISPGFIDTEMTREVRNANPVMSDVMTKTPPLKRIGTTGDLLGAAVYLLSDASSYTTAGDIVITGGLHVQTAFDCKLDI
ncbi:related to D-arabinitol 2-dehydrogenase [Cephalotrichum gorgonifer]|uniref:Related to D-arabinitol 2-dehydrogenase n=1 Tax=Cephalotrichum gorgonifer TaxID=2041049 RepID=A0AAE8SY65_9PEZI|nr:related to D-arabinitol 2-dehydrogenase [Cephalotrichum gorgonifer]